MALEQQLGSKSKPIEAQTATGNPSLPKDVTLLMEKEEILNDKCRGGAGNDSATNKACDERSTILTQIEAKGWCWGHEGQAGYERTWEPCHSVDVATSGVIQPMDKSQSVATMSTGNIELYPLRLRPGQYMGSPCILAVELARNIYSSTTTDVHQPSMDIILNSEFMRSGSQFQRAHKHDAAIFIARTQRHEVHSKPNLKQIAAAASMYAQSNCP